MAESTGDPYAIPKSNERGDAYKTGDAYRANDPYRIDDPKTREHSNADAKSRENLNERVVRPPGWNPGPQPGDGPRGMTSADLNREQERQIRASVDRPQPRRVTTEDTTRVARQKVMGTLQDEWPKIMGDKAADTRAAAVVSGTLIILVDRASHLTAEERATALNAARRIHNPPPGDQNITRVETKSVDMHRSNGRGLNL